MSGAVHADLELAHDSAILLVRRQPYSSQLANVIVDALNGVPVHQPLRSKLGAHRTQWQHPEGNRVIGEDVVPGRRIMKKKQRADVQVARYGIAECSFDGSLTRD